MDNIIVAGKKTQLDKPASDITKNLMTSGLSSMRFPEKWKQEHVPNGL